MQIKKSFTSILLALICLLVGCQKPTSPNPKPSVLVSIAPYAYFVQKIAGDTFQIECLVPEGANPHIYEPRPKDVERFQNVQLWIRLGESSDQKVHAVLTKHNPDIKVIDVTEGIELLSLCEETSLTPKIHSSCAHDDSGKDIHIWLSPRLAKKQASNIAEQLILLQPEHEETYKVGLTKFLNELELLDQQITTLLLPKKNSAILVSHPAFAYFCKDYGLIQLSVEMEGKDPLPQHITELLKQAKRYQITTVLLQPQYSNKGAELIAQKLYLPTMIVDPYATDYIENIRFLAEIIARS